MIHYRFVFTERSSHNASFHLRSLEKYIILFFKYSKIKKCMKKLIQFLSFQLEDILLYFIFNTIFYKYSKIHLIRKI